jgi:hypothetical protein
MNPPERGNARSARRSRTELTELRTELAGLRTQIAGLQSELAGLVYELLDAHDDTASLAVGLGDIAWLIHLDYLRALQRRGREILARLSLEEAAR